MSEQEMQMKLSSQQEKVKALRQEVSEMNKEQEYWQHYRIQASIAAMQGLVSIHEARITAKSMADKTNSSPSEIIAMCAVSMADELIKELKSNVDAYAEGRRQTAINESAICNLIAELQKKGGEQ